MALRWAGVVAMVEARPPHWRYFLDDEFADWSMHVGTPAVPEAIEPEEGYATRMLSEYGPRASSSIGEALYAAWNSIYNKGPSMVRMCLDPKDTLPDMAESFRAEQSAQLLLTEEPRLVVWQMTLLDTMTVLADVYFRDVVLNLPSVPERRLPDASPPLGDVYKVSYKVSDLDGLLAILICNAWLTHLHLSGGSSCMQTDARKIHSKMDHLANSFPSLASVSETLADWARWMAAYRSETVTEYDGMVLDWKVDATLSDSTLYELLDFLWADEWAR